MLFHISFRNLFITALVLVLGLSFAMALPLLADKQGAAATQIGAPIPCKYHVSKSGSGTDGLQWSTAFTNVQDAIAAAAATKPCQVWVAQGVYYPDVGGGQSSGDRFASFVMTDGVELYGGFPSGNPTFSDRDWEKNVTVLSGDIDGGDTVDASGVVTTYQGISGNNSFHVVTASGVTETAILDGFIVTAGYANVGSQNLGFGAGLINLYGAAPKIENVIFSGNWAIQHGGGLYNHSSNPTIEKVIFVGNKAGLNGGGLYNKSSYPEIKSTTFYSNTANYGGGMNNDDSSPIIVQSVFSDNLGSDYGGGLANFGGSSPVLTDVSFFSNTGTQAGAGMANTNSSPELYNVVFQGNFNKYGLGGGGIYNQSNSRPKITNTVFSGNYSGFQGGAISNHESLPVLTNVTFSGNKSDGPGGAISNQANSRTDARNTIIWNNMAQGSTGTITSAVHNETGCVISFTNSLVEGSGGSSGWVLDGGITDMGGNIDQDPTFIDPVIPLSAPTTGGDLRLNAGSPAIDTGGDQFVVNVPVDLDGETRQKDGTGDGDAVVDMGAYEAPGYYLLEVAKSGSGSGTVTSDQAGIDCGNQCSTYVKEGSHVSLMADPEAGSIFLGWGGDCSGLVPCEVTVDSAKSVTANFEMGSMVSLPIVNR